MAFSCATNISTAYAGHSNPYFSAILLAIKRWILNMSVPLPLRFLKYCCKYLSDSSVMEMSLKQNN